VAPVPLDTFDPKSDCPLWLTFLDEALGGDAEAIRFLQQWLGYSLTGITREQALLFVYGPGGSGKGTAINTVGNLMGDYAVNVGMETLTASRFDRHLT
jgi:putative DNA primase/helicase